MVSRWLPLINRLLCGIIAVFCIGAFLVWLERPSDISSQDITPRTHVLKNAFEMPQEAYTSINEPIFPLAYTPPTMQVPDLRQQLIYHGKNGRPDAQLDRTVIHFGFRTGQGIFSVRPGEKIYLQYLPKPSTTPYALSPNNQETSLWIETALAENDAMVQVFMKNEKGELIQEPSSHCVFGLQEKEAQKGNAATTWQINNLRVDGTLLARQHARWYGKDPFLENHGGDEYSEFTGKQRIDFGKDDDLYSVFVGVNDCLIWNDEKWVQIKPGEESLKHPLLVLKKVEDRLMTFELWDVEGKAKIALNLLKSTEAWSSQGSQNLQRIFKFVGARKKSQFIFEINNERLLLSPNDWLLCTEDGWKKLSDPKEIDEYVTRKATGVLFVFEGIARKDGGQVLIGELYNATRSEMLPVELSILQGGGLSDNPTAPNTIEPNNAAKPKDASTLITGTDPTNKQKQKTTTNENLKLQKKDDV